MLKKFTKHTKYLLLATICCGLLLVDHSVEATYPKDTLLPSKVLNKIPATPAWHKKKLLRVMSLNIAHGSHNRFGIVPMLRGRSTIEKRLDQNAIILNREGADVVGFQEADGPSWWSGNFHHVEYIAREAGYPWSLLGFHVNTKTKKYGTGLISRLPMLDTGSYRFKSVGMFKKGFVIASIAWPGKPKLLVDIVSVHLHPSRAMRQRAQVKEMAAVLRKRNKPVIIMGDFNAQWSNKADAPLKMLQGELGLRVYKPNAKGHHTHKGFSKRRLDWIFISERFRFVSYRTVTDVVSDHYGVVADIKDTVSSPKQPTLKPITRVAPTTKTTSLPATSQPVSRPSSQPVH